MDKFHSWMLLLLQVVLKHCEFVPVTQFLVLLQPWSW